MKTIDMRIGDALGITQDIKESYLLDLMGEIKPN